MAMRRVLYEEVGWKLEDEKGIYMYEYETTLRYVTLRWAEEIEWSVGALVMSLLCVQLHHVRWVVEFPPFWLEGGGNVFGVKYG